MQTAHDLSQFTSWNDSGWLVVDASLETSWAPLEELYGFLGLDGGNGSVDIFGDGIISIHQEARHVFNVSKFAFSHHESSLENEVGDFDNRELFMICFRVA